MAPVLGLSLLSLGTAAHAQVVPERRLDIGISLLNSYESNILRLPRGVAAPPGQSRDDLRATPDRRPECGHGTTAAATIRHKEPPP